MEEYFKKLRDSREKALITVRVGDNEYSCTVAIRDLVSTNGSRLAIMHMLRQIIPIDPYGNKTNAN